ncbi:MAG TPA: hypothetical protein VM681_07925 [Candidatus Thermoplasmatota archaeon]|nr:hypothetical protein [Candidatus Thermoplasmatota archaeon]
MKDAGPRRAAGNIEFLKFVLVDAVGAAVIGVVSWVVTGDHVSSFLLSMVTGILILLVELRYQLTVTREELSVASGLQRDSLADPFLLQQVPRIVHGYTDVARTGDAFFTDRAREVVSHCAAEVVRLQEGYIEVPAKEVFSYVKRNFHDTRHSVFGTVFVQISDFWFSGGGREYLQENFEAIRRGVKVQRVFIIDDLTDLTLDVQDLIRRQAEGGIDVRVAFTDRLTPDLLHDMGIYDDKYAVYVDLIPGSRKTRGARFYRDEAEVRKAKQIRDRIVRESEPALEVLDRLVQVTPRSEAVREGVGGRARGT